MRRGLGEEDAARAWLAASERHDSGGLRGHRRRGRARALARARGHAGHGARRLRRRRRVLDRHPRARAAGARRRRGLVPAQPHRGRLRAERGDGRAPGRARHAPAAHRRLRDHRGRGGRAGARRRAWTSSSPTTTARAPTGRCPMRRSCTRPCAATRAPTCAPPAWPTSSRPRCWPAPGAIPRAPTRTSTSSPSPPSPTASRCATRTAGWCARACTRWPRRAKPGIRALLRVAKVDPGALDARAIGFRLAPRINAAGRLYRADAGLELVLTDDAERAAAIADELDHANAERRHTETRILFEAEAQVRELGEQPAYVLAGEGWHPGVIGIVASRIAERHHRPCVMLALDGDEGTGSGRSIPAFDLLGGARRERRAPAAPRRAPRRGGLHDRARSRSMPSAPPSSRTRRRSWRPEDLVPDRARRRRGGGRRARPRAGRGARAARALRDRQPVGLAARAGRAAGRRAADGRGGPPRALHRRGRRPPRPRGRLRRQPAARRRRARRDVHARAQRVERRGRAAAGPAPRPGARAGGGRRWPASPRTPWPPRWPSWRRRCRWRARRRARPASRATGAAAGWPARWPRSWPRASPCSWPAPTRAGAAGTSTGRLGGFAVAAWHALERDPALDRAATRTSWRSTRRPATARPRSSTSASRVAWGEAEAAVRAAPPTRPATTCARRPPPSTAPCAAARCPTRSPPRPRPPPRAAPCACSTELGLVRVDGERGDAAARAPHRARRLGRLPRLHHAPGRGPRAPGRAAARGAGGVVRARTPAPRGPSRSCCRHRGDAASAPAGTSLAFVSSAFPGRISPSSGRCVYALRADRRRVHARRARVSDLQRLSRSLVDLGALVSWFLFAHASLIALDLLHLHVHRPRATAWPARCSRLPTSISSESSQLTRTPFFSFFLFFFFSFFLPSFIFLLSLIYLISFYSLL